LGKSSVFYQKNRGIYFWYIEVDDIDLVGGLNMRQATLSDISTLLNVSDQVLRREYDSWPDRPEGKRDFSNSDFHRYRSRKYGYSVLDINVTREDHGALPAKIRPSISVLKHDYPDLEKFDNTTYTLGCSFLDICPVRKATPKRINYICHTGLPFISIDLPMRPDPDSVFANSEVWTPRQIKEDAIGHAYISPCDEDDTVFQLSIPYTSKIQAHLEECLDRAYDQREAFLRAESGVKESTKEVVQNLLKNSVEHIDLLAELLDKLIVNDDLALNTGVLTIVEGTDYISNDDKSGTIRNWVYI